MSIASIQRLDDNYVLNEEVNKQYTIVFDNTSYTGTSNNCIIPVKSRREIELLLLILGEEVNVIMDRSAHKQFPDVWDWLCGRTYTEVFTDLKWSYREADEVVDIIGKIPLSAHLSDSFIKTQKDDPDPERINPDYVHKIHNDCVLISNPYQCGNMFYFNGFNRSSEFNIDHNSDHLEGIIIFEATRQAGIASAHFAGMPMNGALVILKTITQYSKFVECSEPFLIRTLPVYKSRGGVGYCVYDLVQKGKSCAAGYFSAIAYNSKDTYNKFRNSKLLNKALNDKAIANFARNSEVIAK